MYKHILIPIDDSELAEKAIDKGIELAKAMHARLTAFTAMPEYVVPTEGEVLSRRAMSLQEHEERAAREAKALLERVAQRAAAAGVECGIDFTLDDQPDEAIAEAAERLHCDLILMASHGRSGLSAIVKGSQTRGVLARSKVPTLVYR